MAPVDYEKGSPVNYPVSPSILLGGSGWVKGMDWACFVRTFLRGWRNSPVFYFPPFMNFPAVFCRVGAWLALVLVCGEAAWAGNTVYNNAVLADGPVGFWSFDEVSGTVVADKAVAVGAPQNGAQDGVYENCTLGQASRGLNMGTSVQFNGSNSRVRIPAASFFDLGTGNFSVELWYKTPATTRGDLFVYRNTAPAIDLSMTSNDDGTPRLRVYHNTGFLNGVTAIANNTWHHVVMTRSGTTARLYLEGVEVANQADALSVSAVADLLIGGSTASQFFNGWIDEVAYYPSALSAARVGVHYGYGIQSATNAPVVKSTAATSIGVSTATLNGAYLVPPSGIPAITFYYGTTDGGTTPGNWQNSALFGQTIAPSFAKTVTGLASGTTYYFALRGTNANGEGWSTPGRTFTTVNGLPAVANVAATNIQVRSATLGAQVTATPGATPSVVIYYGTTDGGTTVGNWANSVSLGVQAGAASANVTGLAGLTTYYFRALATNSSGSTWAASTATFMTAVGTLPAVVNLPATDITGYSASPRGQVTATGNDPPIIKVYYGTTDGGTTAGAWQSMALLPEQSGSFAAAIGGLAGSTTYYFRCFAQNSAGGAWASATSQFTTLPLTPAALIINEIHYHPVEQEAFNASGAPVLDLSEDVHEFVEIYNNTAAPYPMEGVSLSSGVTYTFAAMSLPAHGYVVVAKNPARMATVYAGLTNVVGPYSGKLSNTADTLVLNDAAGVALDQVSYSSEFPWPTGADGLGAADDFTLLNSNDYQYKGRSLQRIHASGPSNDPANWQASAIGGAPTPGAANALVGPAGLPVAVSFGAVQAMDDSPVIRAGVSVRIQCAITSTAGLTGLKVESFVDSVNSFTESRTLTNMTDLGGNQFTATLPGQVDRSVVRYRILTQGGEQICPRADEVKIVPVSLTGRESWQSYFVTPVRTSVNPVYDLFVSDDGQAVSDNANSNNYPFNGLNGLQTMAYNAVGDPKRATTADSNGYPRDVPYVAATDRQWNGSVPAVFVENGNVRDAHIRYHGSRYNRRPSRPTYKLRFSKTQKYQEADSEFITDKSDYFSVMHGLYVNANLPISEVRWIDWYLNAGGKVVKLEQGEYNGDLLDKFHARQAALNPGQPVEASGEFYKNVGIIGLNEEGPYSIGDGRLLTTGGLWQDWQKYLWTYLIQTNSWIGSGEIKGFFQGMWTARGDNPNAPNPNTTNLRAYFDTVMDVDTELTSMAILNWSCPWDDTTQNHFFWRRANGRWAHFPWDFDGMFGNGDTTGSNSWIYLGENGNPPNGILGNNSRGPNYFKDSFLKAYRTEYNNRLWLLNNTYLHPDTLKTIFFKDGNGTAVSYYDFINGAKANFCEERFASVNTQLGHSADGSDFLRPNRPTHVSPAVGASALPPGSLVGSVYTHTSGNVAGSNAHTKSKWEIRAAGGTYLEPVYTYFGNGNLTALSIPFDKLTFGQSYSWRVTYYDALEHPSITSLETAFLYGIQSSNQTIIALGDSWKYNQVEAFNDGAWKATAFNDGNAVNWPTGASVLAAENQADLPAEAVIHTTLIAPDAPNGRITTYFRKHFTISTNPANLTNLRIRHFIDDGCVIYINGTKIHRYRMANNAGDFPYNQLSASSPGDAVSVFADASNSPGDSSYVDPRPYLVQGDNVIAVEVHQSGVASTDATFGLEMTATFPPLAGDVVINEIMASNRSAVANGASYPDWVELKNNTNQAINLGGNGLSDDILQPTRYVFPPGTMIPAQGYLMVWCDSENAAPGLHSGFGLSLHGQRMVLTNGVTLRDYVDFGPQALNLSIGRIPNGTGSFSLVAQPTPTAANTAAATLGAVGTLMVNEWMASRTHGDDWFELYNPDANPVALGTLYLSDTPSTPKITQIPALSFIAGKGYTDFTADGTTQGFHHCNFKLSAGGERILITNTAGTSTINSVTFGGQAVNVSQGRFPDGTATIASFPQSDSRGESNWLPIASVRINEALSNSLPPLVDYIEMRNSTGANVDVSNWWLSDDKSRRQKFQLPPGSILSPNGFLTIYEPAFNTGINAFALGSTGDEIVLSAVNGGGTETGYRAQVSFGAAAENVSFGEVATSGRSEFWAQTSRTPNAANNAPLTTPVMLNEIHYHPVNLPGGVDNTRDEFIELHNPTTSAVDLGGWVVKSATDFTFAPGTMLLPGDYLVLVSFNPQTAPATLAAFRAAVNLPLTTTVLGPFAPKLQNDEASVELSFPGPAVGGVVPYILADKVSYTDYAPWPAAADGTGPSLQRISRTVIGNDPSNWVAAVATPGSVNSGQSPILDNDGDGIPNAWELAYGLNIFSASDAALDNDGDGQSNAHEYLAQTDPTLRSDVLALSVTTTPTRALHFLAKLNVTYTVQISTNLTDWSKLTDIPAGPERMVDIPENSVGARYFYRLITPQQP